MGIKQMLAERTRKKLRFAVLRPKNPALIPTHEQFLQHEGIPADEFQQFMNDTLRDGAIFMGFLKPGCTSLFSESGEPTGEQMKPGDVLDLIEDFKRACEAGSYQLESHEFERAGQKPSGGGA
jgi:hypothetical protein